MGGTNTTRGQLPLIGTGSEGSSGGKGVGGTYVLTSAITVSRAALSFLVDAKSIFLLDALNEANFACTFIFSWIASSAVLGGLYEDEEKESSFEGIVV